MATVTIAPISTTSAFPASKSDFDKRHVQAELNYFSLPGSDSVAVDFTQPGAEQKFKDLAKCDTSYKVLIQDIRGEESKYTLDKNGFQYVQHPVEQLKDCGSDEAKIAEVLLPATEELVKKVTGATKTVIFAHRIRCFASDEAQRADNRAPAHSVHTDFSQTGALHHLESIVKDSAELLKTNRVQIINVWRPLKPIRKDPLAVCDWASTNPTSDLLPYRMTFPQSWNEMNKGVFNENHQWYHLGGQKPDEPVIFKQFDSKVEGGITLAHSAFVDPEFSSLEPRESIEIKMFAFVPEN